MDFVPYLNFNGNCREAMSFYADLFGADITMMSTFGETEMAAHVPPEAHERIMHAAINVNGRRLLASDALPDDPVTPNGFAVTLQLDDLDRAQTVFAGLAVDGTVDMPLQKTFWAAGFGMVRDRFGILWMLNVD